MPLPRVYATEACPLEGYEALTVRVLANATDGEWKAWAAGNLGTPGCEACQKLSTPPVQRGKKTAPLVPVEPVRRYCPACEAARAAYAQSIVLFYGPTLLGEDVSTPEAALALFDRDDALPSEIVIWLELLPGAVRNARAESLLGNLTRS
jgi:hypothetical protein